MSRACERVRYLQWQVHESQSAPFYERLVHLDEACPQADYPQLGITF